MLTLLESGGLSGGGAHFRVCTLGTMEVDLSDEEGNSQAEEGRAVNQDPAPLHTVSQRQTSPASSQITTHMEGTRRSHVKPSKSRRTWQDPREEELLSENRSPGRNQDRSRSPSSRQGSTVSRGESDNQSVFSDEDLSYDSNGAVARINMPGNQKDFDKITQVEVHNTEGRNPPFVSEEISRAAGTIHAPSNDTSRQSASHRLPTSSSVPPANARQIHVSTNSPQNPTSRNRVKVLCPRWVVSFLKYNPATWVEGF